jgi:protein translocase SecG subunit
MSILIAFLTLVLVVNSLLLILLVLIQLPKKEAGAGLAFGGSTTDALFGAGSGNALTKLTKYAATTFLGLSLLVGLLNARTAHASGSTVRQKLATQKPVAAPAAAPAAQPNAFSTLNASNTLNVTVPTNAAGPAAATTNVTVPIATTNAPVTTNK